MVVLILLVEMWSTIWAYTKKLKTQIIWTITITHDSSDYILNLNAYVNNKTEHTTYKISGRKGKQKLGVLEKKWFRVVVLSYPATNCSSVSGVCSLKLEYGQWKKKQNNKKQNAADRNGWQSA